MKRIISYLLALNIFLCYGGVCNLYASGYAMDSSQQSSCHSMKVMENEQIPANSDSDNETILSVDSSGSMCQYFIVSKALVEIDSDFSSDIYILNQSFSEQNSYKNILDKFSLKIPDKVSCPKLFLKNSSFLI